MGSRIRLSLKQEPLRLIHSSSNRARFESAKIEEMTKQRVKVRVPDLLKMKRSGQKITMLTAYDATMALLIDRAGIDVILVGDSLGMVVLGEETTVSVTLDMMVHHCRAVANGAATALVVADLPFLTYQASPADAIRNAGRLMQEGRATAVKLEGGIAVAETVRSLVNAGVPVMGHVGLLPQSVHLLGGFHAVGRDSTEAGQILRDAQALESAGAFAVVLECVSSELARRITDELSIPTIGIGSGRVLRWTGVGQLRCLRPFSGLCTALCKTLRQPRGDGHRSRAVLYR